MDEIRQLIAKLPREKRLAYVDVLKTAIIEKKLPEVSGRFSGVIVKDVDA